MLGMIKRKYFKTLKKVKDFVIENGISGKRIVLSVSNLFELKLKACKQFGLSPEEIIVVLQDGTELDDEEYFQTRPNLTFVILVKKGDNTKYLLDRAEDVIIKLCNLLSHDQHTLVQMVKAKLHTTLKQQLNDSPSVRNNEITEKLCYDRRDEHPEWFEGLPEQKTSKEDVLRKSCQSRFKTYYYKAKDDLRQEKCPAVSFLLEEMWNLLQKNYYNGHLFVRSQLGALCSKEGRFLCQGAFDKVSCNKQHTVNPYLNSHHRIMFGTWNLDHQIERSRSVVPAIKEASRLVPPGKKLSPLYFYSLLFTTDNLRLVHLVCHKKEKHIGKMCDKRKYYTVATPKNKQRLRALNSIT